MTKMRWFALGAAAVALGACSDSVITAPTHTPGAASRSATLNGNSFTIASDAGSQFCSAQAVLGVFSTFPASFAPITSGCTAAEDLQTDGSLAAYNPGWEQLTGGDWIGFQTNSGPSSDYRPTPGIYVFQQTFTLPSGVTAPGLSLNVLADNVVAVYLNGHHIAEQTMTDCNPGDTCHWTNAGALVATDNTAADFNANPAVNYITFLVNDVPTGYPVLTLPTGGPAPQYGCTTRNPQLTGSHLFTGDQAVLTSAGHEGPLPTGNAMSPTPTLDTPNPGQVGCENPSGLAFAGSVTWTPPAENHGCTLGFWKTHTGFGSQADAWPAPYIPGVTTLGGAGFTNTGNQNTTMLDALSFSGGPTLQDAKNNLMKQAVAALLNAATTGMNYPLTVAQVLSQVNTALASGNKATILALATTLDGYNSLEGPLC